MVSRKSKKKKCKKKVKKKKKILFMSFFYIFLKLGKTDMVLGKKVAIFDWEWGRNLAPREGQKIPCHEKI